MIGEQWGETIDGREHEDRRERVEDRRQAVKRTKEEESGWRCSVSEERREDRMCIWEHKHTTYL